MFRHRTQPTITTVHPRMTLAQRIASDATAELLLSMGARLRWNVSVPGVQSFLTDRVHGPVQLAPCADCGYVVTPTDGLCSDCLRVTTDALQAAWAAWETLGIEPRTAAATAVKCEGRVIGYVVTGRNRGFFPVATANVLLDDDGSVTVDDFDRCA